MKIQPKSKKAIPPPAAVAKLISTLLNSSDENLASALKDVDSWKWPRSDLNAWIKVLDKFDDIMGRIISEYNVEKLQLKPFDEPTKFLLSEILRFERLLLENSTNRKTFQSYDRLNSLLSTSDVDILILSLNLLLRPAQQYSAQASVSHAVSISTTRLQSLSKRWPHLRENGISLVDLTSERIDQLEGIPAEARELNMTFYRIDSSSPEDDSKNEEAVEQPPTTPRKPVAGSVTQAPSPDSVQVRIEESVILGKPVMEVLADATKLYTVPESESFELLCRIRAASALASGRQEDRRKLVIVRLLAIAIYGHTHSDAQAASALFLYEPDLITHIAELLQVDQGIPVQVQTVAIAALDALARYKSRVQEVLTAVNAGVNHGILLAMVRNMVAEVSNLESQLPHSFIEALLSFITYLASHASGGNMVVSAGLIPLLVQIIENRNATRLAVLSKTMQLVDNVIYSFTNAFSLFCASKGVDVLVDRIEYEIDFDISQFAVRHQACALSGLGELPIQRAAVLKHVLRSIHRMMQSSGTAEGLRGLIDTSLLKSIKKVMDYRGLFGSNVFPLAINIMSTFVHNEPTSLAIIQEAGLPETFYKAIEIGIEPAIEVIQSLPNAIGALSLNEAGQAQLAKHPSIIPAIIGLFTSDRHLKILIDKENAVVIGTAVDELIRHHPSLKTPVFEALRATLGQIENLGSDYVPPAGISHWYQLLPGGQSAGEDVSMTDPNAEVEDTEGGPATADGAADGGEDDHEDDDPGKKNHDNTIVSYIDALGRFLEGFFQYPPHCKDLVLTTDCLQRIGRITGLPCLPYDFANSVSSDSMVQVLRTMTEVATNETLLHLSELVRLSLDETKFFWESIESESKLFRLVELPAADEVEANRRFRSLVTLHIRITLLSDVFATAGQAQGRAAIGLLQTLMNNTSKEVLSNLGALHRSSVWENISLNAGLASKGLEMPSRAMTPEEGSAGGLPVGDGIPHTGTANGVQTERSGAPLAVSPGGSRVEGPRNWNASSLKHLAQGLPNALAPFFQAMVKMFHARRNPDASQKKQITDSSKIVASIMLEHLHMPDFDSKGSLFSYYAAIFELFFLLLVDDRTTTCTLHSVELFAFYQTGGFEAAFNICDALLAKIDELQQVPEDARTDTMKKDLSHAFSTIRIVLRLVYSITSAKPLFESGQTLLIVTRDKKDTDLDYFEPHNFLVKLRSAVLPTVRRLWQSPWLIQAPIDVSRYVVRTVLEIVNAENEEYKGDPNSELGSTSQAQLGVRPMGGFDEGRIRILTDMGFPRSHAERALIRTNNNVNSATELLLSRPYPLPPDPMPEPMAVNPGEAEPDAPPSEDEVATPAPEPAAGGEEGEPTETTGEPAGISAEAPHDEKEDTSVVERTQVKSMEEWRKSLHEEREPLKASVSKQSLLLIDQHLSLLFDLHIAFTKVSSHQQQAIRDLVDDVKAFSANAYDVQEQPLANRCRLLALVLCETPSALSQDSRQALMENLLALLLSSKDLEHPPKWLAAHLLVTEALFTLEDEPRSIVVPKEEEPIPSEPIFVGHTRADARNTVFDFCVRLLCVEDLPMDELLSVLRLFVLLTRDRDMAVRFVQLDGLNALFRRIRKSAVTGASSYVATILRHVVEDAPTIQTIMQQTVRRYFSQPRTRIVDVVTYVRNCSAIALRDVNVFMDVTKSLCQLELPYSTSPHIKLQADSRPSTEKAAPGPSAGDMQVDAAPTTASTLPQKSVDAVIHLLVSELISTAKGLNGNLNLQDENVTMTQEAGHDNPEGVVQDADSSFSPKTGTGSTDDGDKSQYLCYVMQCLTELLFSYDPCKVSFLSYSTKKRTQQSQGKDSSTRFRTVTLQFLLSELVTYGTINPASDAKFRSKGTLCSWAMNVIGALCVDTSAAQEMKEISPDLLLVRRFVLETVSRAIKDLSTSSEGTQAKYGRLLALSDLCHRLLTVRVNPSSRKQAHEDIPTHLAKIMLEKNFVAILTSALSEVDLNYPNAKNLVASILRPLEYLTKIAIKMSKASGKLKEEPAKQDDDASSTTSSDSSMEDDAREETPDLYRNSALGMYGGEMDDRMYSDDEEMGDEEDEQDVEMDYAEDTDSEDTSESQSDDDDVDIEQGTQNSGEGWQMEDEESDDDLVANPEQEEDEDEDDDGDQDVDDDDNEEGDGEDEDDDEEGMMWEEADGLGMSLNLHEEGGHGVPIQVNHDDEGPEVASDEDEFLMGHTTFNHDGIFNFGTAVLNAARDGGGIFVQRRHRNAVEHHTFGRPRNTPPTAPEAITHPLLLDMSAGTRVNTNNHGRGLRHRIIGTGSPEALHALDAILTDGSLQAIEQLMHDGGGGELFHIEVPAGSMLPSGRRLINASARQDRVSRPTSHRQGREFDPLLTLQRWAEEMKILHGDFVVERVSKLANHLVVVMLPAALEAIKQAKEEAERKAEEEKKKEEEGEKRKQEEKEEQRKPETEVTKQVNPPPDPDPIASSSSEQASDPVLTDETTPIVVEETQGTEASEPAAMAQTTEDEPMADPPPGDVDTEMVDVSESQDPVAPPPPADEPVASTSTEQSTSEAVTNPTERVTVMIHGSVVDITDTGIDPTFLEALPDDMREEVLNQHVRDQQAARVERPADSQISSEFLDALPPDIRAEIIQQEAMERSRRRNEEAVRSAPPREPAEIDPASFIASLDPTLRQAVLMDQDDGFLQSLPPHMLAEAGAYRDEQHARRVHHARSAIRQPPTATPVKKSMPQHDAIMLLDRAGVAVLVRLLFYPQVLKKNLLFKVLVNVCENLKTRVELFNLLLCILQEGAGDLAAVDKSFSQMTVKSRDMKSQTPKSAGKQKAIDYVTTLHSLAPHTETVPDLIAQRCLEALTYIVSANEQSSLFFLTENELPTALRKPMGKKGKGKEKQSPQTHYPLVLLLNLLDRQSLLRTPAILDSVVGLLSTVTRGLTSLKDQPKVPENVLADSIASASGPSTTEPSTSATNVIPQSTSSPDATSTEPSTAADAPPAAEPPVKKDGPPTPEAVEDKALLPHSPQIPDSALRLIVNILTIGDCSGRTFQQSLTLIQHLSYIPDARDVIAFELKAKAQEFGQALFLDLDELAGALQDVHNPAHVSSVAAKFSPSSSTQAKLLRVLKTIDYMYTPKTVQAAQASAASTSNEDVEKVQAIYESFHFPPLWRRLGDCLSFISENSDNEHIATVLLPLIESLMVVCKFVGSKSASGTRIIRSLSSMSSPRSPTTPRESMEELFISFTDEHRKILNVMVRNNPSLMSGSFSLLVSNSRVLDFDNKRNYFNQQLHRKPHLREHHGTLQLNVRRARVFEDSFLYLQRKTGEQIKHGKLSVRFYEEEGVDAGGLTREWFQILARQMFNPNYALFQPCAADKLTYQPNKASWVNPEHLSFFKFVGRVIGKAIYDGRLLDAYFARSLYRQLLGKPVDYRDVEWVDPEYYNSLCWILENDPTVLDLTFSVEADEFGVNRIVALKDGGEQIQVTQDNKREYVQLSAQYRLHSSIKEQIENLSTGFYEIIPKDLITIFNEQELELLISGTPDIDVDEWRAATEYNGYNSSDPNIIWWWRALKSFNREERAKVLSFATGTSRVPLNGFLDLQGVQGVQKFSIHRAYGEPDRLPQAHTCFNQIDLPPYTSYEMLRQQLLLAIHEGGEGFAFS